jgi:hypothetical protein
MNQITTVGVDLAKEVIVVCAGGARRCRPTDRQRADRHRVESSGLQERTSDGGLDWPRSQTEQLRRQTEATSPDPECRAAIEIHVCSLSR